MSFAKYAARVAPLSHPVPKRKKVFDITKDLKPGAWVFWRHRDGPIRRGIFTRYGDPSHRSWDVSENVWAFWEGGDHEGYISPTGGTIVGLAEVLA